LLGELSEKMRSLRRTPAPGETGDPPQGDEK
jgi:hypothetical protein